MENRLLVFVSSVIGELWNERETVKKALESIHLTRPWVFEYTPASADQLDESYLGKVRDCDLFILLVAENISDPVRKEWEIAKAHDKRRLVFLKDVTRTSEAEAFVNQVDVKWVKFRNKRELQRQVQEAVGDELIKGYRRRWIKPKQLRIGLAIFLLIVLVSSIWFYVNSRPLLRDPVEIPAGEFIMGSTEEEVASIIASDETLDGSWEDILYSETPTRMVSVDAFEIDRYEVTNYQYAKCYDEGKCKAPYQNWPYADGEDDYPVVYVTWADAQAYCKWVGGGLPTEIEWEKAARGTDGRRYPWGDGWDNSKANAGSRRSGPMEADAMSNGKSPYGVFNMTGNVREWTATVTGDYAVVRGGSWRMSPDLVRCAFRQKFPRQRSLDDIGFRCVYDVEK